jgi:hypothetical protein
VITTKSVAQKQRAQEVKTYRVGGQEVQGSDVLARELAKLRAIRKSKDIPVRGHDGLDLFFSRMKRVPGFSDVAIKVLREFRKCRYERLPNGDPYRCRFPTCPRCGNSQKVSKAKRDHKLVLDMIGRSGLDHVSYVTINGPVCQLDQVPPDDSRRQRPRVRQSRARPVGLHERRDARLLAARQAD